MVPLEFAAALDRTRVIDQKAVFDIAETAKSLRQNNDKIALNRNSIH